MDLKISVITPAYNAQKYLKKCIDSIMRQTFRDFELILVNDASTDDTQKIIDTYTAKYPDKIKAVHLKENMRQGGARNAGLDIASGKYICFVDSDDWIDAHMLEKFCGCIEMHACDMVLTNRYYRVNHDGQTEILINRTGRKDYADYFAKNINGKVLDGDAKNRLIFSAGSLWLALYRADYLKQHNIRFPERLSYEDNYFVTLSMMYINTCYILDEPFYYYYENLDSTIHKKNDTQLQRLEIEKMLYEAVLERGLMEDYHDGYELRSLFAYINTVANMYHFFYDESVRYVKAVTKEFNGMFPAFRKNRYYKTETLRSDRMKILMWQTTPSLYKWLLKIKGLLKK